MAEGRLRGGSGNVRGGFEVVCFSEAPVEILARMFRDAPDVRYRPFGVMVPKTWLFAEGGRPVIYEPESEYDPLPEDLKYRHVRLQMPGDEKDFTFEREWRIRTPSLELDPASCTLIVPDRDWDYRLRDEQIEADMDSARLMGLSPFTRISNFKWHVLALGDLGVKFEMDDDTP